MMSNIPFDEYRALKGVNISSLLHLGLSPRHYKAALSLPGKDTPAMVIGRAVHTKVLEPWKFDQEYIEYTGRRAGAAWQAFALAHADRTILNSTEMGQVLPVAQAIAEHPNTIRYLHESGRTELTLEWRDKDTDLECKGRIDWLTDSLVLDLKTSREIAPKRFARSCSDLEYVTKMAWYRDAACLDGLTRDVVLLVAEKTPPFDVVPYRIPEDYLRMGRVHYKMLLRKLAGCLEAGTWPGIASGPIDLELSDWQLPGESMDLS